MVKVVCAVVSISVGLASAATSAQEIKGGPEALVGLYGHSPEQCRSYHRKSDNITSLTKTTYTFCGGMVCEAKILSHRKTSDGYVLRLQGKPNVWTNTFRQVDENILESVVKGSAPETLVKCGIEDAIAGIGRNSSGDGALTQSLNLAYSAFYALQIPLACKDLQADGDKIKKLVLLARAGWVEHLIKYKLFNSRETPEEQLNQTMASTEQDAKYGVRADSGEIPDFCSQVLSAFGSGGRVIPDLIADPRKKA